MITQPLPVGPDPLATAGEQFSSADGDIIVPTQLKWMTDFEAARTAGMAFRVNLTPRQATQGFDRLYVLGVRLAADAERSRQDLETLIQDLARSQSGFAIVPQGTATNNTESYRPWGARSSREWFDVPAAQLGITHVATPRRHDAKRDDRCSRRPFASRVLLQPFPTRRPPGEAEP